MAIQLRRRNLLDTQVARLVLLPKGAVDYRAHPVVAERACCRCVQDRFVEHDPRCPRAGDNLRVAIDRIPGVAFLYGLSTRAALPARLVFDGRRLGWWFRDGLEAARSSRQS